MTPHTESGATPTPTELAEGLRNHPRYRVLGLLGTVMGLIRAFAAVATVNPAEKANLLSASISVAMNCTAFGLMTAVPLLFIHAWLQTKTTELIDSLEMAALDEMLARAYGVDLMEFVAGLGIDQLIELTAGDVAAYVAASAG